jgi:hypothetical protein
MLVRKVSLESRKSLLFPLTTTRSCGNIVAKPCCQEHEHAGFFVPRRSFDKEQRLVIRMVLFLTQTCDTDSV